VTRALFFPFVATATVGLGLSMSLAAPAAAQDPAKQIENVVVIYLENRSFDHLYGVFPGADGIPPKVSPQTDRDGSVLPQLPKIWNGLTAKGAPRAVVALRTVGLPNAPFAIDDPKGFDVGPTVRTTDTVHDFYQMQMQINGGKNDKFVAWGNSGALPMGYYQAGDVLPLWSVAKRYVLADRFFQGAFGGSFLNHFWLICACTPIYTEGARGQARHLVAAVEEDGVTLKLASDSPRSAAEGPPKFIRSGPLTPDLYAVGGLQPPFPPSDPTAEVSLPPQTAHTIGDLLTRKGIRWAWYSGAWQHALDNPGSVYDRSPYAFQPHHQPFNYFASYAPGTLARNEYLRDAGVNGTELIKAIDAGALPPVTFYKPQGSLNEHPGYADVVSGEQHVATVIEHLERSPQWARMLVIVTYDESGGFWDHVAPPKGDRWGPGSRIPAIIISPVAKKGTIDHTEYDTTSILRFIIRRWELPALPGITARDKARKDSDLPPMGDLTQSLMVN